MRVWPAIDLRGGKCVRLQQGDYDRETVFGEDPTAMARQWVEQGADCLHLVDLDGARDGHAGNAEALAAILQSVKVPCQIGGGIRDEAAIERLLEAGAARLVVGTQAIKEPIWFREMIRRYPGKLALGLDARDGMVATDGWLNTSGTHATQLVGQFADEPLGAVIFTDIARDGMLSGPNLVGVTEMAQHSPVPVIASGGVSSAEDIRQLAGTGAEGCIVGRALYDGRLSLADALQAAGQPI